MRNGIPPAIQWLAVMAVASLVVFTGAGQPTSLYTLVEGSQIVDDCPICDRIPVVRPLRGTFEMRLVSENPLFSTFAIERMSLTAVGNGSAYKVTGGGTYVLGGELALRQDLFLDVEISDGVSTMACKLTNALPGITRPWPMLQISVDQTNGTVAKQYHLDLNAAPFREIWFSTVKGFTAGAWNPPTNAISGGDLLSAAGRVVKRNHEMVANLGVMPPTPDLGLKDCDILPGAEVVFSVEQDFFSESLGPISQGDLLSQKGRVVARNSELVGKFSPQPPLPSSFGLAALQMVTDADVLFSVQTGFFSESLGVTIYPGDLLSQSGKVVRSGKELLAKFSPATPDVDYGLAAVFLWPTNPVSGVGEIWFSTAKGFSDKQGQSYAAGDLLSDQGYLVFRNAELLSVFAPASTGDLGLDALFLISDMASLPPTPALAVSTPVPTDVPADSIVLNWSGPGRVFQVERASMPIGPYVPVSQFLADETFVDIGARLNSNEGYYRIREW